MPAILEPDSIGPWLSGNAGTELLKPAREDALRMWLAAFIEESFALAQAFVVY